jgi:hypothetical protein
MDHNFQKLVGFGKLTCETNICKLSAVAVGCVTLLLWSWEASGFQHDRETCCPDCSFSYFMHSIHTDLNIVPHLGHNCLFHVLCNSSFTKIITFSAIQSELLMAVLHKQQTHTRMRTHTHTHTYVKSKAIPVQAWTGPEGS